MKEKIKQIIKDENISVNVKEILNKRHPELNTFFNSKSACLFYVEI